VCDRSGAGAPRARHPSAPGGGARLTGCGRSSTSEQEIEGLAEQRGELELIAALLDDPQYSRSFLRGLLVLGAFPPDGSEREVTSVAAELEVPAGTTHRYIGTWLAVGLLDQDPTSRRYKRAQLRTDAR
jgi:hypothetical protein